MELPSAYLRRLVAAEPLAGEGGLSGACRFQRALAFNLLSFPLRCFSEQRLLSQCPKWFFPLMRIFAFFRVVFQII